MPSTNDDTKRDLANEEIVMTPSTRIPAHKAPHPGAVAIVFATLFLAGLWFVISMSVDRPHFPGPWESMATLTQYFVGHTDDVLWCAALQFGSAIPLGIF